MLIKGDIFEVISDNLPDPVTNDKKARTKKDKKARALISLSIEDDQITHVKHLNTSRQTCDTLREIHERSNFSSKVYLLRKLYSTKLNEGGNMIAHITKILEIGDKLSAIGEIINSSHISALLLCSLLHSYDTLITALETSFGVELKPIFSEAN